jgi:taurine dioxygenase
LGFNGEIYALTVYYRNREIALTIIPSDAPPAAEIQTVDLRNRSDEDFDEIHRAWLDHLVILFRRQQLAIEDLIAFSRRFWRTRLGAGAGDGPPFRRRPSGDLRVSNVIENGAHRQPGCRRGGVAH